MVRYGLGLKVAGIAALGSFTEGTRYSLCDLRTRAGDGSRHLDANATFAVDPSIRLRMKTQITLAVLSLTLVSGWGQGEVDFRNSGITFRTQADRYVYRDQVGGERLVGTNYVAGLWFVPGNDPAAVDGRISPERGRQAGRLFSFRAQFTADVNKGTWVVPAGAHPLFTLDGVGYGEVATLQVRVWDSVRYASFQAAFAAGEFSVSEPFSHTAPFPGWTPDETYMDNLRAFPNPSPRTMAVNDLVVAEGSNGVARADFIVTLHAAQSDTVSVDYSTQDGTAIAGEDYLATSGTLTFALGETAKTISVTLTPDAPAEPDETFSLRLSNPVNGVLGKFQGTCTITEVRITGISVDTTVSFNTVGNRRYTVERSGNAVDWEPVLGATSVLGTGGVVTIIDRGSGCQSMRVYRARLVE